MAKAKGSALDALKKLRDEQLRLATREAELKTQAAQELGLMLVEIGAETLDAGKLRALVRRTRDIGIETALERLAVVA